MSMSRRQFVKVFGLSAATLGALGVAGCSDGTSGSGSSAGSDGSKIQTIKDRGVLNCGVKADVIGYGYMDTATQEYEGLEIDLCYQIAAAVFEVSYEEAREQDLCAFTTVTPTTRGTLIDSGQLDIVAATYTITPEREEDWDFSTPYRTDSVGIMVKKANGWTSMEDLDGQTIGVSTGSTTQQLVTEMIADEGFSCTPNFVEYQSYPEIKDALDAGMVQAFAMDRSTLNTYMDDTVELLQPEVEFGTQDYGVATEKGCDLSELVDDTVNELLDNGWMEEDIQTWLGESA
ncbi:transporter substrate-binding domain-containing protein [Collinsella intestinalis]|uniref:transporter substrate-binding domain-containing protein n=1 Tax=Collinsella intestinalis TaxID=147207 RepID=UPI0025A4AACD|nr:transporter substrate-binding domain-containing protein [Collinsella intestinalis]MDM8162961.1 transporter substrate-binding domain-containing protein [Collinsella intestinalis]